MVLLFVVLLFMTKGVTITSGVLIPVKIGIICDVSPSSWQYLFNIGSAMNIAVDQLKEDGVIPDDYEFSIVWKDTVETVDGVGNVVDLVLNENVDVIFGSPSSRISVPAAHLTAYWNFPQISWAANSFELSEKSLFNTFVRSTGPLSEVGKSLVVLFKTYQWERIGLLYIDEGLCLYSAQGTKTQFAIHNLTVIQSLAYPPSIVLTNSVIDEYLLLIKQTSRIVLLCTTELRRFLIRAYYLGMCNGEYLFIYTSLDIPTDDIWKRGDNFDRVAKAAAKYLLYFVTAMWTNDEAKKKLDQFNVDVIARMSEHPWNSTYAAENNITAGDGAQSLYHAMYMYGLWVNYSQANGINVRDGRKLMEFSKSVSFQGVSGPFHMGDNGDREPDFWIFQFPEDEAEPKIVTMAETKIGKITEPSGFKWYTRDGSPPSDIPLCGYFNEYCIREEEDSGVIIALITVGILLPAVAVLVIILFLRKRKKEAELLQSIWKININEIDIQKSMTIFGSKIRNRSPSMTGGSRILSDCGTHASFVENTICTTVAMFRGQMVCVRTIRRCEMHSKADLFELKTMREMVHENVNPFLGACFDAPTPCAVFSFCHKGSLQDILENDEIKLDSMFKYSMTLDLVQGMVYIHSSNLQSHGRLKSTNCLVDNRWVLKITDYGIGKFLDHSDPNNVEEHQRYKSLLWTAPELLADPARSYAGTKEGDVYSFGIVLHEIYYRMGTFPGKANLTAKDIIARVRNKESTPCRPEIFNDVTDVQPAIVKLMQMCWLDNEHERPTFNVIRTYLKKKVLQGDFKHLNIVDVILNRLEKYANNLEDLVESRTQELVIEKQKTDKLLYRMLPRTCADKLKVGAVVQPELYDSATVYFSDIVGFTTLSSKSTPIQVVDLLNDLYTCFDAVIAMYDAYKVETIGDAYLVVSGIPERNGDNHAGIMADMSLDILDEVSKFKVSHLPNEELRVRIGMHTGPCCAGVVGLSMPRYCLFGDTVNTASRMESNGEANKIHISESTHLALMNLGGYHNSYRGDMPIKGKGIMSTYWLTGSSTNGKTRKARNDSSW